MSVIERSRADVQATPERVLVVDDERSVTRLVARWLERDGMICDVAHSTDEALALAAGADYAVVFADIHMPGGSGLDLAPQLKAADPAVQVVIMTGNTALEMAVEALRMQVDDYLVKPFEAGALRHAARRATDHRRLLLENIDYRHHLETRVQEQAKRLERLFLSSILALVTALEAKDPYTRGHTDRVTEYALAIHREAGGVDQESLRIGAQLHDIGKIGVRSDVLLKDGPLTEVERADINRHPDIGVEILAPLLEDDVALDVVHHHHERWDGAGYPDGLAGTEIPLGARIVAVADAYDAMTTIRPYRPARSPAEAVQELEDEAGRQFDPDVVIAATRAFLQDASLAT